jgi:hypothetical protein
MFVYSKNLGGSIVMNDDFYAEVFSNPLFQFFPFFWGILNCLVYMRYKNNRLSNNEFRNSFSSRTLEMIQNNSAPRYFLYLIGIVFFFSGLFWQTPFVGSPEDQTRTSAALYASLSFPIFIIGFSFILMPALIGRAEAFRFVFGSQTWTLLASTSLSMYYIVPFIAIFYFMTTQHQITVTYSMFVYPYRGIASFGIILNHIVLMQIDKPIYAFLSLKKDVEDEEGNRDYQLQRYL